MERIEVLQPDDLIELFQGLIPSLLSTDIIAGRENMASIDTDADGNFFMDQVQDVGQVFESPADR